MRNERRLAVWSSPSGERVVAGELQPGPEFAPDVTTEPAGAVVFVSRRRERAVEGRLGPLSGDVEADELVEGFVHLGGSPVQFRSPPTEEDTNASILGFGGMPAVHRTGGGSHPV